MIMKCERKYAIKLLSSSLAPAIAGKPYPSRPEKRYDEIESVVRAIWLTAEQPCGKRLVPPPAAVAALLRTAL